MTDRPRMPDGLTHTRTTDTFTHETVPAGLLRAHRVANGVWGRLVVYTGTVGFIFEDQPDHPYGVEATEHIDIPPGRLHHVEVQGAATFAVEFYRAPADSGSNLESTGLAQ